MTGNMQNGSVPQGGMPGPASNMPPAQQYQRAPQPQQMPNVPMQGTQQPPRQQPMSGGVPPTTPNPTTPNNGGRPNPPQEDGKGSDGTKKRNLFILIGVIVVVVIVIAGAFFFVNNASNSFYDPNAKEGQASYKTPEEIEAERNRQMQEGMLNISIASQIEFENGTAPGMAYIENVPSNKYVLKVTITTDSNGEVVYQSGGIKPDSTIETITLSQPLGAGVYPATATFSAYDPDTLQEVGQAAAKVTLVVKN